MAVLSKCLWLVVALLFLGCARNYDSPPAELGYFKGSREGNTSLYEVSFSSTVNFLNVFEQNKRPISSMLRCSLEGGEVSMDHEADQYSASGLVPVTQAVRHGDTWVYRSALSFYESLNGGRSMRALKGDELRRVLQGKQFVPCVYTATAYGFKSYRSGVLQIPIADILYGLNE